MQPLKSFMVQDQAHILELEPISGQEVEAPKPFQPRGNAHSGKSHGLPVNADEHLDPQRADAVDNQGPIS